MWATPYQSRDHTRSLKRLCSQENGMRKNWTEFSELQMFIRAYHHASIPPYIHAYIHTRIHTHTPTHKYARIHTCIRWRVRGNIDAITVRILAFDIMANILLDNQKIHYWFWKKQYEKNWKSIQGKIGRHFVLADEQKTRGFASINVFGHLGPSWATSYQARDHIWNLKRPFSHEKVVVSRWKVLGKR